MGCSLYAPPLVKAAVTLGSTAALSAIFFDSTASLSFVHFPLFFEVIGPLWLLYSIYVWNTTQSDPNYYHVLYRSAVSAFTAVGAAFIMGYFDIPDAWTVGLFLVSPIVVCGLLAGLVVVEVFEEEIYSRKA